jgi:hypothetical protein
MLSRIHPFKEPNPRLLSAPADRASQGDASSALWAQKYRGKAMRQRSGSGGGRVGYAIISPSNPYSEKSTVFQRLAQSGDRQYRSPIGSWESFGRARRAKLPDDRSPTIGAGASADYEVA